MRIGLVGDIHGHPEWTQRCIAVAQPDVCLQVGDFRCYREDWSVPFHWIAGNHEISADLPQVIAGTFPLGENSIFEPGGAIRDICGIKVLFLPGLPRQSSRPAPAGYPQAIYDRCLALAGKPIDLFVSHGCGFPFSRFVGSRWIHCEEPGLTDLLRLLKPKFAVSGHNHVTVFEEHEGISCIRLGSASPDRGGFWILETDEIL